MDQSIKIALVGDICFGDHYFCCGFGVNSVVDKYGSSYLFEHVGEELAKHDIVFGNLETVLSTFNSKNYKLSSLQMRGHPKAVEGLKKAGFSILAIANNHIMQHGREAVNETMEVLKKNGIGFCGIASEHNIYPDSNIIMKKGIKVCFLGYNQHPQQYFVDEPMYTKFKLQKAIRDVKVYKQLADVIIISLHWGDEFIEMPSPEQQVMAHNLIDCGANVIWGHHPHVVQSIEKYKHGYIFYSSGNFVCDMIWSQRTSQSFIASIDYHITNAKLSYTIIPTRNNRHYQPVVISQKEAKPFIRYIDRLSVLLKNYHSMDSIRRHEIYRKRLEKVSIRKRRLSQKFWLKNLLNYRFILIIQFVLEYFSRRIQQLSSKF